MQYINFGNLELNGKFSMFQKRRLRFKQHRCPSKDVYHRSYRKISKDGSQTQVWSWAHTECLNLIAHNSAATNILSLKLSHTFVVYQVVIMLFGFFTSWRLIWRYFRQNSFSGSKVKQKYWFPDISADERKSHGAGYERRPLKIGQSISNPSSLILDWFWRNTHETTQNNATKNISDVIKVVNLTNYSFIIWRIFAVRRKCLQKTTSFWFQLRYEPSMYEVSPA